MPETANNTLRAVRVLHLASGDLWAGAEAQVLQQATHLAQLPGLAVQAVVLNEGELAQRLRAASIRVHVFPESELSTPQIMARLSRVVRSDRVDIIHTHRAKENFVGGLVAFLHGRRSLRTAHGAQEHPPRSILNRRYVSSALDRFAGRRLQQSVVAVSKVLAEHLQRQFPGRVIYIPNGIDVHEVRNAVTGRNVAGDGRIRVGIVGRLMPVKRVDVFLQVAAELIRRAPGKYRFCIIGDGPLREPLQRQAEQAGIAADCEFLGFRTDSLQLIAGLDALMLTSDHEGQPMVALEALAAGVPVVAHAVGGLTEIVASTRQGLLVQHQEPKLFADAIEVATGAGFAVSGSRLDERFDIRHTTQLYHVLYRQLLDPA